MSELRVHFKKNSYSCTENENCWDKELYDECELSALQYTPNCTSKTLL